MTEWTASSMGKKGGAATSPAKTEASQENGRKGGRPKGDKMNARIFRHPTGLELIVARPDTENLQAARDLCPWFDECQEGEKVTLPNGVCFQLRDDGVTLRNWT